MINVLSETGQQAIQRVAESRALLAFDLDGTLSPIVQDRDAAQLRPETRRLLRITALLYPCAVISGRTRAEVVARVSGVPLVAVVGNHGTEAGFGPPDWTLRERVAAWRATLARQLGALPGVEIEDKGYSVALHYRQVSEARQAEERIREVLATLGDAVAFHGRAVVNVLPAEAPNKGDALRTLRQRLGLNLALYVGDDCTDEEVFGSGAAEVGIRVGDSPSSAAPYSISAQSEVDDLLRALITARIQADGFTGSCEGVLQVLKR